MKKELLFTWLFVTLFVGCTTNPKNELRTRYEPPPSSEGQQCVRECKNKKTQCNDRAYRAAYKQYEKKKSQCSTKRQIDLACHITKKLDEPILEDTPECVELYNECYEICGGTVTEDIVCVENCEGQ